MKTITGYKFLQDDNGRIKSQHGSHYWEVGKWYKHDGELVMCEAGFHASPTPLASLSYNYGNRWFKVKAGGKMLYDADKFVASEMMLEEEIQDVKRIAVRFAVDCARRHLDKFEKEYPHDNRPRAAIEAAEAWLQNTAARAAARAAGAAWAAARAAEAAEAAGAAWAAGAAEAAEAAEAAGAAGAAGAAWAAEQKWQNEHLLELIGEAHSE